MGKAACSIRAALAGGMTAWLACYAHAAPEMIVLSSATYDSGAEDKAYALTIDGNGNIFIAGNSGNDYLFVKYNKNLQPSLPQVYSNGRSGNVPGGIAVDGFGNIVVAGMEGGPTASQDYLVLKYSPDFATLLSSASYDGGFYDRATAVIMDEQSNVYMTGFSNDGATDRFYTMKYDSLLNQVAAAAFDSGDMDQAYAMAFSGSDIIVAGVTRTGGTDDDIRLVRYDRDLNYLPPSVTFNSGGGDMAVGAAVDSAGNVIVTARRVGTDPDFLTLKYDSTLSTLISSAVYDSGGADTPKGLAVDSADNIIVTGFTNNGGALDFFTIKYDSSLNILSTAAYDGGLADIANAVSADPDDNVVIAGQSYGLTDNFFTVKYNASPRITSVSPLYIGETANVTFTGRGLLADTVVSFADPAISTGTYSFDSGQITLSVTPAASVTLGGATVTVTNSNGEQFTNASLARTRLRRVIPAFAPAATAITALTELGNISVSVPAYSFTVQETLTLYTEEAGGDAQQVGEALFIAGTPSSVSLASMTVTLRYAPADLGGYPEASLSIGYYDPAAGWV
ncbi:MAG: SBBP repeat-containing protein, partial [Elusimicrobiales bacterium]|nr:SBBP repeat-containing protein [Elusimicrobiales bacterium]